MKLSLALICAPTNEEAEKLDRCLSSAVPYVDEACITITGENEECEKVCKKHGAKISHFEWVKDFAKARNFNFSQCTGDWIMWLDADDVLDGGEHVRKNIELAEQQRCVGLQVMYDYMKDTNGNVIDRHWQTQIIKNDGHAKWVGKIHETLIAGRGVLWCQTQDIKRIHTATQADSESHHLRNIEILEKEIQEDQDEPRNYIYLGRSYLATNRLEDALRVLSVFIRTSGWDEERYEAKCLMGECYEKLDKHDEALMAYSDAFLENEECPYALVYKARVYATLEKWRNVRLNIELAHAIQNPKHGIMHRPMLLSYTSYMLYALALLHLGDFKTAKHTADSIKHTDEHVTALREIIDKMFEEDEMSKAYARIAQFLKAKNEVLLPLLLSSVPTELRDDPRILSLQEPKTWDKNSIAIYCGIPVEPWIDGDQNGKGIGGSETAVIELAKRLVKKGWKVTVFNSITLPPEGVVVNGVEYKNTWTFSPRDTFDVLWVWRMPQMLDYQYNARKVVLDLHDVGNAEDLTPERIEQVDHIFVKTNFHRSLYPNVSDNKFIVVGNGIALDRFTENIARNPYKIIYSSAPNRGLEHILSWWGDIKKAVPQAELHTFYGWETFVEMNKNNKKEMDWMYALQDKMKQDGIVVHGRVGQKELAKEILSSGIWLYPTEFPEIHCITACEMQAGGAYPITSGFGALAETQLIGDKIPVTDKEAYIQAIKNAVQIVERKGIQQMAQAFSWDTVTNTWHDTLQ